MKSLTVGYVVVDMAEIAYFVYHEVYEYIEVRLTHTELVDIAAGLLDNAIYWAGVPGLMGCPLESLLRRNRVGEYEISRLIKTVRDMVTPIVSKCHDLVDEFGDLHPDNEDYRAFLVPEIMLSLTAKIRLDVIEPPALDHDIVTEEAWDGYYI